MIILYILLAFLGSVVMYAVDKEDGIFLNICMQLAASGLRCMFCYNWRNDIPS